MSEHTKVKADITMSLDGYIAGRDDRPGQGMGEGGERLHDWIFGGPYDDESPSEATGEDKAFLDEKLRSLGAVVGGRSTYDNAEAWGGSNPYDVPFFIVTHRPEDAPEPETGFTFVDGLGDAIARARQAAGDKEVLVMGGADTIRQALADDYVDELAISIAPVVLGGGKRLFQGSDRSIELEQVNVRHSPLATHITYRVKR
jgi:dihydrofolate reductase